MQGSNTMTLNTATMIEAVQFWLDSRMKEPVPTVTNVSIGTANSRNTFDVQLSADADRPSKPEPAV